MGTKMEIELALDAHARWRKDFRDYLNGRAALDTASIGSTDQCDFGRWLLQKGRQMLPLELHDQIQAAHGEFHRIAADVLQKIKEKRFAEAHAEISADGTLNQTSARLADLLRKASLHATESGAATPTPPVTKTD